MQAAALSHTCNLHTCSVSRPTVRLLNLHLTPAHYAETAARVGEPDDATQQRSTCIQHTLCGTTLLKLHAERRANYRNTSMAPLLQWKLQTKPPVHTQQLRLQLLREAEADTH